MVASLAVGGPPAPDAAGLRATNEQLATAIDAWREDGATTTAPEEVERLALRQQLILRHLRRRPALARRVVARLPRGQRRHATEVLRAMTALHRLSSSDKRRRPAVRVGPPRPPAELLRHYRDAQRRFGVGWHVLAAINFVETGFGKLRNESTAGARGPMQFIPATWRAYGMGGDVRDPRDAIMGAANYLRASGAPRNYRRALYAYNPTPLYVDAVRRYARRIATDPRAFYAFHAWSVFWGGERVTGPGRAGP